MSSAIEKGPRKSDRWIVVEAAGFHFAFPLGELDAVVEISSGRIRRTQGRRRPGILGVVEWAGDERKLRSLAEHVGLQSRVIDNYPTLITRPEPADTGPDGGEPCFWAVERVVGSFNDENVHTEPVPPEWWSSPNAPYRAIWWNGNCPVWIVKTAALVACQPLSEEEKTA